MEGLHVPEVTAVVLNWNRFDDTARCLSSLREVQYPRLKVIVVDNGSTDGSAGRIEKAFPWARVIRSPENTGFSGGSNIGIEAAFREGSDYVLLLNNDAVVDPSIVRELTAAAGPSIGVLGAMVYMDHRPDVIEHAGGGLRLGLGYNGRARGFGQLDSGQYREVEDVDWVSGCALMVPREMVSRAGLLDPDFFCYCEDVDWCLRARKAGLRVVIVPAAKVRHRGASSTGQLSSSSSVYYYVRNQMLLASRHAPLSTAWRDRLREWVILMSGIAFSLRCRKNKISSLAAAVSGARDFHRGRLGKREE